MPKTQTRLRLASGAQASYTRSDMPGVQDSSNPVQIIETSLPVVRQVTEVPNWKVKIAQRLDATGDYERREIKSSVNHWLVTAVGQSTGERIFSFASRCVNRMAVDPTLYADERPDPALRDLALKRLKGRIADRSEAVNLLIPLVELRELRGLIKAVAYSSIDIVRALIDIKRTKGKSAFKYASHAWLNWSFGLAPTISEVNDILETIDAHIMRRFPEAVRDSGSATKNWITRAEISTNVPYGTVGGTVLGVHHTLGYRFTCGYVPALKAGNDYSGWDHFGLNFGSMVPAVWELTPFSWLFDYFTTMGDFLEDTFVDAGNSTIYVSETMKYDCSGAAALKLAPSRPSFQCSIETQGGGQQFSVKYLKRTKHSQLPRRSLRYKTLSEISGVGRDGIEDLKDAEKAIKRVLNLASVLVGGRAFSNRIE